MKIKFRFKQKMLTLCCIPMLPYMNVLKPYGQYWFVTITPYGRDIEPNVPDTQRHV